MKEKIYVFRSCVPLAILTAILAGLLLTSGCSDRGKAHPKDLSGTWRTESVVPYLTEHTLEKPEGNPVPHEGIRLLKRWTTLEWNLNQQDDGLLTGTNNWVVYNEENEVLYKGFEPLIGAVDGKRIVVIEALDIEHQTPQVIFECFAEGPDRLRCIGYDVGSIRQFIIRFDLIRN